VLLKRAIRSRSIERRGGELWPTPTRLSSGSIRRPESRCGAGEVCGNAVIAGGLGVTATIGSVIGSMILTATNGPLSYSCQGEHYDVNQLLPDGCEQLQPLAAHDQSTAAPLGSVPCNDLPLSSFNGVLYSDSRIHQPAITGLDPSVGTAPEWYSVNATGGLFCIDDFSLTLTITGSSQPGCYKLTMITDKTTVTAVPDSSGTATISGGSGSYSDGSTIYFKIEKACPLPFQEAINYNVNFHL
jgi:hypothetical protein